MGKLEWRRYPMVKNFEDIFIRFGATPERDRQTDRQTDGHRVTAYTALMHMHPCGKNVWCSLAVYHCPLQLYVNRNCHVQAPGGWGGWARAALSRTVRHVPPPPWSPIAGDATGQAHVTETLVKRFHLRNSSSRSRSLNVRMSPKVSEM